jgi:hypothetical protein
VVDLGVVFFRRRRIGFRHFHPESGEDKNPENPVDPVQKLNEEISSIHHNFHFSVNCKQRCCADRAPD